MDSSVGEQSPINASDNTDYPVAKDRYGDQITYDGNPACLPGIMHDVNKWIERTGHFKLLFEHYAVPLSNGALAIDQPDNIQFIDTLCAHAIASAHPPRTHRRQARTHRRQARLRRALEGV